MKAFQDRVVHEQQVLDGNIGRLTQFIADDRFNNLTLEEQERMNRQLNIMMAYSAVLVERIAAFT